MQTEFPGFQARNIYVMSYIYGTDKCLELILKMEPPRRFRGYKLWEDQILNLKPYFSHIYKSL